MSLYVLPFLVRICIGADSTIFLKHIGSLTHHNSSRVYTTISSISCAARCLHSHIECNGYTYNSSSGICQIYSNVRTVLEGDKEIFITEDTDLFSNTKLALGIFKNNSLN